MVHQRADIRDLLDDLSAAGRRPFTPADAVAAGLSRHRQTDLLNAGVLRAPHLGVRTLGEPDDLMDRVKAAGLVLPPGAAIGRRTAAELMGIDPRVPAERGQRLDISAWCPTAGRHFVVPESHRS